MSSTTTSQIAPAKLLETRVLDEGYGPGAWHGADLKAALGDVSPDLAFWRPSHGRHNIAEIALHHAYCVNSVRARLTGGAPEPFIMEGDDWFPALDDGRFSWSEILASVDAQQRKLAALVSDVAAGRIASPLTDSERFDLVLGITCHAVYHAGQVQLIKRLRAG
jgi:DinB family protein